MKKMCILVLASTLLVSCSKESTTGSDAGGNPGGQDYYPLAVGNTWYYTDYADGVPQAVATRQIAQTASLPDGTTVFNTGNSKLKYVRKTATALLFYQDLTDNTPECSWPWPFAVGNQIIDCDFDGAGEIRDGTFTAKETITVPYGTFECYRLDWTSFSQWYAPGVGQIMYREQVGGGWVKELKLDSCSLH